MTVELDGKTLTPEGVERIARKDESVSIPEPARARVRAARDRVVEVLETDEAVYGLNTGFGELVDSRIPREDLETLQLNLVRSHAAGVGRELEREEVRALLATRINALATGYSGVREIVLDHLATMLEEEIHPVIYARGSLGASGDLAPLAHAALVLVGEGEADVAGEGRLDGDAALATAGIDPLTLAPKEGLALINGTQLSLGLAALSVCDAERAIRVADVAGALTTEVTMGTTVSADPALQNVRPHPGQTASARNVKRVTEGSEIVESHRNCDRVQDAYSIRCLPQVHGAVRDAIGHIREAVEIELNSATDNPLVFAAGDVDERASGTGAVGVLSGGNFHGEPLALKLDYLTNAITDLAAISERRIDRMLNPNVQEPHLPPFLTEESGLESGYMLAGYAAASLLNQNRSLGRPSMDNTPVSGNQEDHVSLAGESALVARRAVSNAITVVAIELVCASQAAEFVDDDLEHGIGTGAAYRAVRSVLTPLETDRPVHADFDAVDRLVRDGVIVTAVEKVLDGPLE